MKNKYKKQYCTKCGKELIITEYEDGYSPITGKRVYRYEGKCSDYRWYHLSDLEGNGHNFIDLDIVDVIEVRATKTSGKWGTPKP